VARQGERLRVLVIDDQAGVRTFVCELLESLGHDADDAEDGPTGLALLPRQRYDLVITDLQMPLMSGWDVVAGVRQRLPTMPCIIISGFISDDDVARAGRAEVGLLDKPFQITEMKRAIQGAVTRRTHPRPTASRVCPVCHRPLSQGGSLLYQGDELVHALCWRDVPTKLLAKGAESGPASALQREEGRSA
jgi:CheY-like chemotaxis protein